MFQFLFPLIFALAQLASCWPGDIDSLKLLQIVHRHGERTPLSFSPNDPYSDESKYWHEGIGQLTIQGKFRLYKLGELIRDKYKEYLGPENSPREVYVRSSIEHRCIESASALLAGAYPPIDKWRWDSAMPSDMILKRVELGKNWQPFPIETFMPKINDTLLVPDMKCPNLDKEFEKLLKGDKVVQFFKDNEDLLKRMSTTIGEKVDTLQKGQRLYDTLQIEIDHGYWWNNVWSKEEQTKIVKQLRPFTDFNFEVIYNSTKIQRVRVGNLIKQLRENMEDKLKKNPGRKEKLFIYSTHDSTLSVLLSALGIFNNLVPPYGATLFIELHQNKTTKDDYVQLWYLNNTFSNSPIEMEMPKCWDENFHGCKWDKFLHATKEMIIEDYDKECGIEPEDKYLMSNILFMTIGFAVGILVTGLTVLACFFIKKKRTFDQSKYDSNF